MAVHVVLIEDHAALREGLELLLERHGIVVSGSAASAVEGHALVRRIEPDVVVIDVALGSESGIELTRKLISESADRRVVIYTGESDARQLVSALDSGAQGYALKDGGVGELADAIAAVSAGESYVDPRLRSVLLSREALRPIPSLSKREREIIDLLAQGLNGEDIAGRLFLSPETIKTHIRNAMTKLDANTRTHAVAIALREGQITLPG